LERDVLRTRVAGYQPRLLDELIATGEVVWVGRGALGSGDGRIALYLREGAAGLVPALEDAPEGALYDRVRAALVERGATFFGDLLRVAGGEVDELVDALWDMVWAGEVTNDTLAPLRLAGARRTAPRPTRRPLMRLVPPRAQGRWSLVADLLRAETTSTERLHARAGALLERHGVLTREAVLAEAVTGGFASLYPVLRAMEEAGRIRRGYFIDGLGASQFALPGAVDRLRELRDDDGGAVAMSAVDPANPYGVTVSWPPMGDRPGRPARVPGAYVVFDAGELRMYLERGGRSLITFGEVSPEHLHALIGAAAHDAKLELLAVDGVAAQRSPLAAALRGQGFGASPRGLVLYPERVPMLVGTAG
jgi:ATP-dependent Lhr-like helicase